MSSRGGKSYWSHWRRVRANVTSHLQELQEQSNVSIQAQASPSHLPDYNQELETDHIFVETVTEEVDINDSDHSDTEETNRDNVFPEHHVGCNLRDSISESSSEDDDYIDQTCLVGKLQEWAISDQVPNSTLSNLLAVLRPYLPFLPKDPRTLLKTKLTYNVLEVCGGQYYHFGIISSLLNKIKPSLQFLPEGFCFEIQLNIDGLPLFKSTNHQFWPILGQLQNVDEKSPFIIGLFSGMSKPDNLDEYLRPFIDEYNELKRNGFEFEGKQWNLNIHSVICDTPARAFVKKVKSFSGYHGCDKCVQNGEWMGKMTYPEVNTGLRTDQSFDQRLDEDHHTGQSPFANIQIGMVSQFPIDYMHLVCLGVMKRLLLLWIKGPLQCRLGSRVIEDISQLLLNLKGHIPSEFARKPRALKEVDRWKATEFRQFLLYTGPVVLAQLLHPNLYKNFLLLSVGIHILINKGLCQRYNGYAEQLLKTFVTHFCQIYGDDMAVYNVHALVHLAKDAAKYGNLECISSFPFENFLSKLKRLVRKPHFPLQQVIRRLSEQINVEKDPKIFPVLKGVHNQGPLPDFLLTGIQHNCVKTENNVYKLNQKDSCVRIQGNICIVQNLVHDESEVHIVYKKFRHVEDFFTVPLQSSLLGILKVSQLSDRIHTAKLEDIQAKCVLLPYRNSYVSLPFSDAVWAVYKYAVVEFTDEKEVEVVPVKWLTPNHRQCYWPVFKSTTKVNMAIKQMVTPTAEYTPLPVKVMYQTDDFMKAREKLSKAEETSDLQTEAEDDNQLKKRARRVNPRYESEDEETEDEEPISKKRPKVPVRKSPRKGKQKQRIPPPLPPLPEWPLSEDEDTNNLPPKTNQPQSKTTESEKASTSSTLFEKSKSSQPSAMDVKMLTCLEHIKAQVHQNTRLLQVLLKKSDAVQSVEEGEPNQFNIFPLKIKEDVDKLEEKLGDVEVTNQLVKDLCTIGGENVKSTVRRLLAFLFANDLAVRVNWKGKGGKIAFSSLRIKDIVTRTVRKNRLTAGATDSEICAIVKDWFRFASDREGGRKKREERKRMNEEKRKENEKGGESGNDTD